MIHIGETEFMILKCICQQAVAQAKTGSKKLAYCGQDAPKVESISSLGEQQGLLPGALDRQHIVLYAVLFRTTVS